jgi:hypothetical protein
MSGVEIKYEGVTFDNVRAALCATFFMRKNMPVEEWRQMLRYVVPMQHNFMNPIEPGSHDTWIQFTIDEDDRITQDYNIEDRNQTMKAARITVRFLGRRAETWAKAFHHLTKRKSVAAYFSEFCNATMLEYVSAITPVNVDYFGKNTTIAHDLSFVLQYTEFMEFDWEPLEFIGLPDGEIHGQVEIPEGKGE